ncbi:uncharacterized protein si:dkey-225f5.4 [Brienomyrus brachyistius]|uniref:uncharacterized protein si:dkey-225f5.4 n=1 Tax=Brienomyrus brachyistius TaxID=42636 RepID=UPI0020B34B50|nr:uncharacterized protein si:dkey-225f5.4 [Brienomyrus brachyistius]
MASERIAVLEQQWEAARRNLLNVEDAQMAGEVELPAKAMVPFLVDSRRKLKVMGQQLCVLDYMLKLLESVESPEELLNSSCPKDTDDFAYAQWKALKNQHREGAQGVQDCIVSVQEKMEQANEKREMIAQLMVTLERKIAEAKEKAKQKMKMDRKTEREASVKLQEVQAAQEASQEGLRVTKQRIANLEAEISSCSARLDNWVLLKDQLQRSVQATLGLTGYRLQWVGEKTLHIELSPQACRPSLGHLEPLSLSLTWETDGTFDLEVFQGTVGVIPESLHGPISQVSATLLEVMQRYLSQGEMLAEIQKLHTRFAIDWQPAQQELVFLKSASVVCCFRVDTGYPRTGSVTLMSVRGEKGLVSTAALQPPQENPSLTEWLEYLSSCPHI